MTLLECFDLAAEDGKTHCRFIGSDGWVPLPGAVADLVAQDGNEGWLYRNNNAGCRCIADRPWSLVEFRAGRPT